VEIADTTHAVSIQCEYIQLTPLQRNDKPIIGDERCLSTFETELHTFLHLWKNIIEAAEGENLTVLI
jgi:hypothetical protein